MKQIYFLAILFFSLYSYSQNSNIENDTGETIIKSFPTNKSLFDESENDDVFVIIETPPTYTGCESEKGNALKPCYYKKAKEFIINNLQYPEVAKKNKIQGRVVARYIINKNGSIGDISVKGNEYLIDETIRLIKSLPKVTPAKQRGKPVDYEITLPVYFKLDDE